MTCQLPSPLRGNDSRVPDFLRQLASGLCNLPLVSRLHTESLPVKCRGALSLLYSSPFKRPPDHYRPVNLRRRQRYGSFSCRCWVGHRLEVLTRISVPFALSVFSGFSPLQALRFLPSYSFLWGHHKRAGRYLVSKESYVQRVTYARSRGVMSNEAELA